jgi:hypothetical protein
MAKVKPPGDYQAGNVMRLKQLKETLKCPVQEE